MLGWGKEVGVELDKEKNNSNIKRIRAMVQTDGCDSHNLSTQCD